MEELSDAAIFGVMRGIQDAKAGRTLSIQAVAKKYNLVLGENRALH